MTTTAASFVAGTRLALARLWLKLFVQAPRETNQEASKGDRSEKRVH